MVPGTVARERGERDGSQRVGTGQVTKMPDGSPSKGGLVERLLQRGKGLAW